MILPALSAWSFPGGRCGGRNRRLQVEPFLFRQLSAGFPAGSEPVSPKDRPRGRNITGRHLWHRMEALSQNYGMRCLSG
ncbi:hypothetical protein STRAU_5875 [Streptomyces aurantiacus JA 4570]|uniref:Uncharacterized protein n=1 Tax=Streptomyces aurantiacus JA 4570 TaxID=1286094 RepID=S4AI37_9ACTN|nr:hypothetical protein STRAU_5875 [Streptomyces aurantiacus JA 4570]